MNQGKAKAFLAIIIALVFLFAAYVMFNDKAMPEFTAYGANTPDPQSPEPEPEPEENNYYHGGSGAVGGQGSGGGGGGGGSTPEEPQNPIIIANYDGYWGSANPAVRMNPEVPLSAFTAEIKAYDDEQWMEITGSYQGQPIYIKFPLEQSTYEGYLSFQADYGQQQSITGSYWKESQNPGTIVSFFTWDSDPYFLYGIVHTSEPYTGSDPWFAGYWGIVGNPTPIGGLHGQVVALSENQTGNVASPWLQMTGPYPGSSVTIRFPLSPENAAEYKGYLIIQQNAADIKSILMTGYYWHTPGGTGSLLSFFVNKGTPCWVFGECYDL